MAIFESRFDPQLTKVDDTHEIKCIIETAQEINGHTEYLLCLQRGIIKKCTWRILRRYNDFAQLHKRLSISGLELPMPGKRFFGNMRPDFIAERRQALQVYINTVLMNPILASSLPAKRFVDPDSYSQSFHDQAVQNALLCLRNESSWTLGSTMGSIGWRLRKHYFKALSKPTDCKSNNKLLVKSSSQSHSQSKHNLNSTGSSASSSNNEHTNLAILSGQQHNGGELVMEWMEFGPDKYIEDKELNGILKSLMNLQHPYIEPIVYAGHNENGCLIIRKFHKHGTLKDILCMSTPKNPFLSKYGNPKGRTTLSLKQVATYGKQILEALIFLHSKGYPYGHLHSGNIVIKDDCVKLLDIENFILGVPSFYRPFFVQHSKIHTPEAIDVYCFGHVLFEMAMGYPLQESVVRQITDCANNLKQLLESVLSKDACRAGLPTFEQLIKHDFFKEHGITSETHDSMSYFKISANAKDIIKHAIQKAENRLREEQKSVKNQKRIVRVQELMSSEEEKRKSKQKAKHDYKQSKLKQQASLQNNNGKNSLETTTVGNSVTESSSESPSNHLSRVNSLYLGNFSHEASTSLKSSPITLSSYEKSNESQNAKVSDQLRQTASVAGLERQSSSPNISSNNQCGNKVERSALLESICKFNRGSLRKVRSND